MEPAAKFHDKGHGYRRMLDFDGYVFLANAVFINGKIVAPDIGKEIAVGVLDLKLDSDRTRQWNKFDLRLRRPGLSLIQRSSGSVRNCHWRGGLRR